MEEKTTGKVTRTPYKIQALQSRFRQTSKFGEFVLQMTDRKQFLKEEIRAKTWRKQRTFAKFYHSPLIPLGLVVAHLFAITLFLRNPFTKTEDD